MDSIWSAPFWKAAAERAISTFAQAFVATIGVGAVGFGDVDWINILSISGVAALLSVVKSLIVNGATETGPSFVREEVVVPSSAAMEVDAIISNATDNHGP